MLILHLYTAAFAVELTADMVSKEGKVTRNGKIYVKDTKARVEKESTPLCVIVRGDKGILWQIINAERAYLIAKLTPDMKPMIETLYILRPRPAIKPVLACGYQRW